MYKWLNKELSEVKWRKFFVFKGGVDPRAIAELEEQFAPLPIDYKRYLLERGDSRLFRCLVHGWYNFAILGNPQTQSGRDGETLLLIGFYKGCSAYFRKSNNTNEIEPCVLEGVRPALRRVAGSFGEWLKKRLESSRKLYKKSEWKHIAKGATPFSDEELRIVDALKDYDFEKTGISPDGNLLIRVHNGSSMKLHYLTAGARAKGRLEGAVRLQVSSIAPGETKIIERDCYKSLVRAEEIELFRKPPPDPEDRELYYEFRKPE